MNALASAPSLADESPVSVPKDVLQVHAAAYALAQAGWETHLITGHAPTTRVRNRVGKVTVQEGLLSDQIDIYYDAKNPALKVLAKTKTGTAYVFRDFVRNHEETLQFGAKTGKRINRRLQACVEKNYRHLVKNELVERVKAKGLEIWSGSDAFEFFLLHPDLKIEGGPASIGVPVKILPDGSIWGQVTGVVLSGDDTIFRAAAEYFAAILPVHRSWKVVSQAKAMPGSILAQDDDDDFSADEFAIGDE